jgi:hypothetical protein
LSDAEDDERLRRMVPRCMVICTSEGGRREIESLGQSGKTVQDGESVRDHSEVRGEWEWEWEWE